MLPSRSSRAAAVQTTTSAVPLLCSTLNFDVVIYLDSSKKNLHQNKCSKKHAQAAGRHVRATVHGSEKEREGSPSPKSEAPIGDDDLVSPHARQPKGEGQELGTPAQQETISDACQCVRDRQGTHRRASTGGVHVTSAQHSHPRSAPPALPSGWDPFFFPWEKIYKTNEKMRKQSSTIELKIVAMSYSICVI